MLSLALAVVLVSAHSLVDLKPQVATYQCFAPTMGVMLSAEERYVNGHRVNAQAFDRNGDGQPDAMLVYEYVGTHGILRPFPTVYVFESRMDGSGPDVEYLDAKGDGRCADMTRIPLGSAFTGKRL